MNSHDADVTLAALHFMKTIPCATLNDCQWRDVMVCMTFSFASLKSQSFDLVADMFLNKVPTMTVVIYSAILCVLHHFHSESLLLWS